MKNILQLNWDRVNDLVYGELSEAPVKEIEGLPVYDIIKDGERKVQVQVNEEQEELRYLMKGVFMPITIGKFNFERISFEGMGIGVGEEHGYMGCEEE